ncbi:hypothetical protein [Rhizobium sp. GN54]|uniref:hypothetical protein n=1 Tax=Rhizobium sp. GN54 TaxID=2898150 RepID=UPI001E28AE0E|nr:hypothetical protein [Rhizobium sp. GN54]MCD2185225.1 hypothetical protein [Rhizobium sp. GN54]
MTAVSFKEALRLGLDLRSYLGFEGAPKAHSIILYASNTRISFRGQQLNISEWSKLTGIPIDPLKERLRQGWPIERALTEPVVSNVERALRARNRRVIRRISIEFRPLREARR